jgi:hypothetical protein
MIEVLSADLIPARQYAVRLHSTFGMIPPAEFEHAHYAALNPEPQPT